MIDNKELFPCVCCGNKTMHEEPPGTYEICPICGWEDDRLQFKDKHYSGGANAMSLHEARLQYKKTLKKHNQKV